MAGSSDHRLTNTGRNAISGLKEGFWLAQQLSFGKK
jgi:hypothetical protein